MEDFQRSFSLFSFVLNKKKIIYSFSRNIKDDSDNIDSDQLQTFGVDPFQRSSRPFSNIADDHGWIANWIKVRRRLRTEPTHADSGSSGAYPSFLALDGNFNAFYSIDNHCRSPGREYESTISINSAVSVNFLLSLSLSLFLFIFWTQATRD